MSKLRAYIINIESRQERYDAACGLAATLEQTGIFDEVALHPAIYWKNKASVVEFLTRFPQYTLTESYLQECLMGQLACALSHISAWQRLLASDDDGAVVFEDDLYVTDPQRFGDVMHLLRSEPAFEWVRLCLHKSFRNEIVAQSAQSAFIDDPQPWGTPAYYVSRSGAAKLLDVCKYMDKPIDFFPPRLIGQGLLIGKAVTEVFIDHPEFTGDASDLEGRHEWETNADSLQQAPSTIFTSPRVADDDDLRRFLSRLNSARELRDHGVTILRGVVDRTSAVAARNQVLDHRHIFGNSWSTASEGLLTGFHAFPVLETLHTLLTGNAAINDLIGLALKGEALRTIGWSELAINRSEPWHVDLLHGHFRSFIDPSLVWGPGGGGAFKITLCLNDGDSLEVVKGSHFRPVPLATKKLLLGPNSKASSLNVYAGDVVAMDLRCVNRNSDERIYEHRQRTTEPQIFVSTVIGGAGRQLTNAMEIGNFFRTMHRSGRLPSADALPRPKAAAQKQELAAVLEKNGTGAAA